MEKYKEAKDRFLEIIEFKNKHGRMPRYKVDPNQEDQKTEKTLYSWMQAMKMSRRGNGTAKCPEWLDKEAEKNGILSYFNVLDKAREQFKNLIDFNKKNNRRPRRYKAENKQEEKLSHWVHEMRQKKRKNSNKYPEWLDEEAEKNGILDWFTLKNKEVKVEEGE